MGKGVIEQPEFIIKTGGVPLKNSFINLYSSPSNPCLLEFPLLYFFYTQELARLPFLTAFG